MQTKLLATFCLLKSIHTLHRSLKALCVIQNFFLRWIFISISTVDFKINSFNWRIITVQSCDGIWYTSTHRYTCVPSSWNLPPPPSSPCPSRLSWNTGFGCPTSCTECTLVICLLYMVMCMFQGYSLKPSLSLPLSHDPAIPLLGISSKETRNWTRHIVSRCSLQHLTQ